jgi:hypothetical protein
MTPVHRHTDSLVVRLLLVAAIAVSHCCLMGHSAWAADVHGSGSSAHTAPAHALTAEWQGTPVAPMVCDGAHAMATARLALPVPTPGSALVAAHLALCAVGTGARPVAAYRDPPDPIPPSRALLQTYLI